MHRPGFAATIARTAMSNSPVNPPPSETATKRIVAKLQRAIVDGLEDVKAQDILVFNTEHLSPLFERVIIASGTSNRQTKALASSVREAVKKAGFPVPRHEGEENGEWIIVDCGQCVAHIMQPAIRQYYRLEEIWGDKPVRLKLGSAKPSKRIASEDASALVAKTAAGKEETFKALTTHKTPAKKAPAKKAARPVAAKKPAAKKPAAASDAATPIKTVVVKPAIARGAAKKPGVSRRSTAAKKG